MKYLKKGDVILKRVEVNSDGSCSGCIFDTDEASCPAMRISNKFNCLLGKEYIWKIIDNPLDYIDITIHGKRNKW